MGGDSRPRRGLCSTDQRLFCRDELLTGAYLCRCSRCGSSALHAGGHRPVGSHDRTRCRSARRRNLSKGQSVGVQGFDASRGNGAPKGRGGEGCSFNGLGSRGPGAVQGHHRLRKPTGSSGSRRHTLSSDSATLPHYRQRNACLARLLNELPVESLRESSCRRVYRFKLRSRAGCIEAELAVDREDAGITQTAHALHLAPPSMLAYAAVGPHTSA